MLIEVSKLPLQISLTYFILAVPMRKCLGKHLCMSSPFPIAILLDRRVTCQKLTMIITIIIIIIIPVLIQRHFFVNLPPQNFQEASFALTISPHLHWLYHLICIDYITSFALTISPHLHWLYHLRNISAPICEWIISFHMEFLIIIIYRDFLPPPIRSSHVKSDTAHTVIKIHPLAHILDTWALIFSSCPLLTVYPNRIMQRHPSPLHVITTRAWEGGLKEHSAKQKWLRETHSVTYVPGLSTLFDTSLSRSLNSHSSVAQGHFHTIHPA